MKLKLVTLIIFLLCIFTCWSCSTEAVNNEPKNYKQELEIFRTDLDVDQEQRLSKIKAENILKNNGYLDSDEIVILVNLKKQALIETYNNYYSSSINSVAEYALTEQGIRQTKAIKAEQETLIEELYSQRLISDVVNSYNTITNSIAVKTTYGNFKEINKLMQNLPCNCYAQVL